MCVCECNRWAYPWGVGIEATNVQKLSLLWAETFFYTWFYITHSDFILKLLLFCWFFACLLFLLLFACFVLFLSETHYRKTLTEAFCVLEFLFVYCINIRKTSIRRWAFVPEQCFYMTSRPPYWCPKTMRQRPCWCPKPVLRDFNFFLWRRSFVSCTKQLTTDVDEKALYTD